MATSRAMSGAKALARVASGWRCWSTPAWPRALGARYHRHLKLFSGTFPAPYENEVLALLEPPVPRLRTAASSCGGARCASSSTRR